ncbi:uncharacterized protein [Lolium perenne]|nr:uncharacterized protein LOC127338182 [Lolium perenne]
MATTTTPASSTLSMKLLIDTKARRVLFAEASKDVVDFLFSLLALPVGTAVKLLGKDSMVGCVGNLYSSVEKLDGTYVQPGAAKGAVTPAASANSTFFLSPDSSSGEATEAVGSVGRKGFVQGIVTYTVMDDLTVTPMSSISGITLLNAFAVEDLSALQEKTVQLDCNEGLEILKASLQSKTVLSDVFLAKKPPSNA